MNYLQLVQDLFKETRMSGTAPTTLLGLTGQLDDLARFVKDAWTEISGIREEWLFKLTEVSFSTASLASDYDPTAPPLSLTDFADWVPDSFRYYTTAQGANTEQFVKWMEYAYFRDYYLFGSRRTTPGPVIAVTSAPNKHLLVGPPPDKDYTIVGQYFSFEPTLALDADIPGIPARLHKIIVYRALQAYALDQAAPEVLAKGERGEARLMVQLMRHQLARPTVGPPLA